MVDGHGLELGLCNQLRRVCESALMPPSKWLGHNVESLLRSLRSFFSFCAASQLTASKDGKRNFLGVLIRSSISKHLGKRLNYNISDWFSGHIAKHWIKSALRDFPESKS